MRLDKFLSNLKYGTRKEVQKVIRLGFVKVNDIVIKTPNYKVDPNNDQVYFDEELVFYKDEIILAINKPKGYVSANIDNVYNTVIELLEYPYTNFDFKIAGRLDLDSEGLMILTTNGALAHQITSPNTKLNKVYLVKTDKDSLDFQKLKDGVIINDSKGFEFRAEAIDIKRLGKAFFEITIDEGKFHQVKRMFLAINLEVISLERVQIGKLKLEDLELGEYKEVSKDMIL